MKKTKIVSTLGPASNSLETISKLIEAGANVFRFNFSHGDHEEQLGRMNLVRQAQEKTGIALPHQFLKYNGRPLFPEEVVMEAKKLL